MGMTRRTRISGLCETAGGHGERRATFVLSALVRVTSLVVWTRSHRMVMLAMVTRSLEHTAACAVCSHLQATQQTCKRLPLSKSEWTVILTAHESASAEF